MVSYSSSASNAQLGGARPDQAVTWNISETTINMIASGLPYHSYGGNVSDSTTISSTRQYYNLSWTNNGGKDVPSTVSIPLPFGAIGYALNGVAISGPKAGSKGYDGKASDYYPEWNYNSSSQSEKNLGYSFGDDLAGGFSSTNGQYHYNDFTFKTAWLNGIGNRTGSNTSTGIADASVISYLNNGLTFTDGHSKILGWSIDGYPIYGPYGYNRPLDNKSGVRKMGTGYVQNSTRVPIAGKLPPLSIYPLGTFVEDYTFIGVGDLDTHNGRYCVTPDFPNGTYAYFITVNSIDQPVFPYIIGNSFYGTPVLAANTGNAVPTTGSYPVWITPVGNLGKIQALQFVELGLLAVDPLGDPTGADITFEVIAGKMPPGLQLDTSGKVTGNPQEKYSLDGVPFAVNQDRVSNFTVRAKNKSGKITDRNFNITVTGNFPPELLTTNYTPLGYFLDGVEVNTDSNNLNYPALQLSAVDLNYDDTIVFSIRDGALPPGLSLSNTGLISGTVIPNVSNNLNLLPGWDDSGWQAAGWQFVTQSGNFIYQFTVQITDGKITTNKNYQIIVYAHNDVRADNTAILTDSNKVTSDVSDKRQPILLTKTMGDHSVFRSGNFFTFKFDGIDYDSVPVRYSIVGGAGTGWDNDVLSWDTGVFDVSEFSLPPGLALDSNTGWLTGYVPEFPGPDYGNLTSYNYVANGGDYQLNPLTGSYYSVSPGTGNYTSDTNNYSKQYTFGIQVENIFDNSLVSPIKQFYITILGAIDLQVNWLTDINLGLIDAGSVSQLKIEASAASGRELYYSLKLGSKIPQGLALLNDGTISGRCSFQTFNLTDIDEYGNRVLTTFDQSNKNKGYYKSSTTFDQTYSFTVIAQDYSAKVVGEKTFNLTINVVTYEPYNDLYILCRPELPKREIINQILGNTDYFPQQDVYRFGDPWWGVQKDIKLLVGYGLTSSQSSSYINAMQKRHYNKKLYFGDFHTAQAKDYLGNVLYEVVYVDIIEDTKTYTTKNDRLYKNIPRSEFNMNNIVSTWSNPHAQTLSLNQLYADITTITADVLYIRTNNTWGPIIPLNEIYPNDLDLMLSDIIIAIGNANTNTLPQWQTSIQTDGKILGFQTSAVLAYMKPGTSARALFNLKKKIPYDIKSIPFEVDRYVLDDNQNANFDLVNRKWYTKNYTTFDTAAKPPIAPSETVDFAVDTPFSIIDGSTILPLGQLEGWDDNAWDYSDSSLQGWDAVAISNSEYFANLNLVRINEIGGLDGTITDYDNKTIIFSTQENFPNYLGLPQDGWIQDNSTLPGYTEKLSGSSKINYRGGVWRINVVNNFLRLTFVKEINVNQVISVRFGTKAGKNYQYSGTHIGLLAQSVPKYEYLPVSYITIGQTTTFDKSSTLFINNEDQYTTPMANDKYLKFPKIGVFNNV